MRAITAMGFAAIENVLYIYRNGYQESGWEGFWTLVVIRVILVGWMHPFFTAFTGIGLAIAGMSRNMLVKIIAVPAGLCHCSDSSCLPQHIQRIDRRR